MEAGAGAFALGRSVNQDVLLLGRQVFERLFEVDAVAVRGEINQPQQVLRGGTGAKPAIKQGL
jgi:hypothetical protein